jgi:uncharacterized protein (DUF1330 family)
MVALSRPFEPRIYNGRKENEMSAYLIFTREQTLDAEELALYWRKIQVTFAGHEVKVLAAYGAHEDLEGPRTEGTVIAEFPSMESARAWYDSPSYRDARQHRLRGAIYRGTLVAGV